MTILYRDREDQSINMANKAANFIREVKIELSKVTWPTRTELIASTIVVIVSMILLTFFIASCDFIFVRLINFILTR